jgi:L-lactate dehydrogenase
MKVGIIGIGSVGSAIASRLQAVDIASEIVLIDTDTKRAQASAYDLSHASSFGGSRIIINGTYKNLADADIVIIAAGANQKIGESRSDLVEKNGMVMLDVVPKIMSVVDKKNIILLVVTNPLDSIVMAIQKISKLPESRVIGTGTMLDSARLRFELAKHFDISAQSIDGYVVGEHGDSSVIKWDTVSIDGVNLNEFVKQTKIPLNPKMKSDIESRVRNSAYEIINGRGATWDGIAASVVDLVKCIANDERRILPTSIVSQKDKAAYSLPRIIGKNGVISSFQVTNLSASIRAIRNTYKKIS